MSDTPEQPPTEQAMRTWPYKCKQDILALIESSWHLEARELLRQLEEMAYGRGEIETGLKFEREVSDLRAKLAEAEAEIKRLKGFTPADMKHGRDHGERITMGELVALVLAETDREKFLDVLDAEFLIGTWGVALKEYPDRNLLRDLRGFIWFAVQSERERRAECERERDGLREALQRLVRNYWVEKRAPVHASIALAEIALSRFPEVAAPSQETKE